MRIKHMFEILAKWEVGKVMKTFTLDDRFDEIMNTEPIGRSIGNLFPSCWTARITSEYAHYTMRQIQKKVTMEWGAPFFADAFVECANILMYTFLEKRFRFVPLWNEQETDWIPHADLNDAESVFLFTGNPKVDNIAFAHTSGSGSIPPYPTNAVPEEKRKMEFNRPAVILCPGGGYEMLSSYTEGVLFAQRMERDGGYKAFVLNYRIRPNTYPLPQMDLAMAVMHIRRYAKEYGIDPQKILVIGASAGGHLCASEAFLHRDLKDEILIMLPKCKKEPYQTIMACPDKIGLLYPVVSFLTEYHEGSWQSLTNGKEALREKLSVEQHITPDYPITYAFANQDDGCVPASNTLRLEESLKKAGVMHLCEIYPSGDHGVALGYDHSCREWSEHMLAFFEK